MDLPPSFFTVSCVKNGLLMAFYVHLLADVSQALCYIGVELTGKGRMMGLLPLDNSHRLKYGPFHLGHITQIWESLFCVAVYYHCNAQSVNLAYTLNIYTVISKFKQLHLASTRRNRVPVQ